MKGGGLTETQIAFVTHREARQLAEAGQVRVPAKLQHLTRFDFPDAQKVTSQRRDQVCNDRQVPIAAIAEPEPLLPLHNLMTVKQAGEHGWLPANWANPGGSFRTAKSRAKKAGITVPEVRATKGSEAYYDAVELADFLEALTKERQAALCAT